MQDAPRENIGRPISGPLHGQGQEQRLRAGEHESRPDGAPPVVDMDGGATGRRDGLSDPAPLGVPAVVLPMVAGAGGIRGLGPYRAGADRGGRANCGPVVRLVVGGRPGSSDRSMDRGGAGAAREHRAPLI